MTKTLTISNFINNLFRSELSISLSEEVKTDKIPKTPKAIEEQIKIRVAIFCMILVYNNNACNYARSDAKRCSSMAKIKFSTNYHPNNT